jgi:hypothetical protein
MTGIPVQHDFIGGALWDHVFPFSLCPVDPSFPPPVISNFISIDSYRPSPTGQVETEKRCSL